MAGRKLFTNKSTCHLSVTLLIRASENPQNQVGIKDFMLAPNQSEWQEYGDHINIYLNGINLAAVCEGQMVGQQNVVIVRASSLDNQLNTNNGVDFGFANNAFTLSAYQVH